MDEKNILVKEIDIVFIARRIRILGIAILLGIIIVYGMGLFVSGNYVNNELYGFNIISLVFCVALCASSFFVKKALLGRLNEKNFLNKYFNAHIIPFAMCDLGGLFCIATNLFVNQNLIFATGGFLFAVLFMILNFPGSDDYNKLKV